MAKPPPKGPGNVFNSGDFQSFVRSNPTLFRSTDSTASFASPSIYSSADAVSKYLNLFSSTASAAAGSAATSRRPSAVDVFTSRDWTADLISSHKEVRYGTVFESTDPMIAESSPATQDNNQKEPVIVSEEGRRNEPAEAKAPAAAPAAQSVDAERSAMEKVSALMLSAASVCDRMPHAAESGDNPADGCARRTTTTPSASVTTTGASGKTKTDWDSYYKSILGGKKPIESPESTANAKKRSAPDSDYAKILGTAGGTKKLPVNKATTANKKKKRRNLEPTVKQYVEPAEVDVLMGRGGRSNHHPGNRRYLEQVQRLQALYRTRAKTEKTDLSQQLVDEVHSYGGRFLKQDETKQWYVVTNLVARRKASQALREENTPERRAAKRQKYQS